MSGDIDSFKKFLASLEEALSSGTIDDKKLSLLRSSAFFWFREGNKWRASSSKNKDRKFSFSPHHNIYPFPSHKTPGIDELLSSSDIADTLIDFYAFSLKIYKMVETLGKYQKAGGDSQISIDSLKRVEEYFKKLQDEDARLGWIVYNTKTGASFFIDSIEEYEFSEWKESLKSILLKNDFEYAEEELIENFWESDESEREDSILYKEKKKGWRSKK